MERIAGRGWIPKKQSNIMIIAHYYTLLKAKELKKMTIFVIKHNTITAVMGFPLSTFQQLAGLCKEEPYIRQTFDDFKLIGIIVHDPDDDAFLRQIKYSFEHLHEVTGKAFAFITFINPPYGWSRAHQGWMETRERLSAGDGCEDAEFIQILQRRLDLPEGPCLILTENLLSNRYVILPTSQGSIIHQMEEIGYYTNASTGRFPITDSSFLSFLSRLGSAYEEQTRNGESLAKNIADMVAVRALTGAGAVQDRFARQIQKDEAQIYVKNELLSLWNELERHKDPNDVNQSQDQLDSFSDYLASIIGSFQRTGFNDYHHSRYTRGLIVSHHSEYALVDDVFRRMEPISLNYILNYNRLLPVYFEDNGNNQLHKLGIDPSMFNSDFSPLGNYLGKAIEEEMNASIVQQVRSLMGVHMPEFYRKYEEALNDRCEVPTRQKTLFLNWRGKKLSASDYTDRSLPIGEVLCVLRALDADNNADSRAPLSIWKNSIDRIDRLAVLRNRACHPGIFAQKDFDEMYKSFLETKDQDLPKMFRIKESLRQLR